MNSFVERLQEDGSFEALFQATNHGKRRQIRSFAYTGDEVGFRIRPDKFGDHLGYLTGQMPSDQVVMCFGMNEAVAGAVGLPAFRKNLETYLLVIKDRHPGSELFPFSPTAVEDSKHGDFPDAAVRNTDIASYSQTIQQLAKKHGISYIDLFGPSRDLFANSAAPLTINGLHLNAAGNQEIAKILAGTLSSPDKIAAVQTSAPGFEALRKLVSRKSYEAAMAYHPANGIHYYGVRSRPFEYVTEIPHHLRLANQLDAAIWAQAAKLETSLPFPNLPTTQAEPPKASRRIRLLQGRHHRLRLTPTPLASRHRR